MSRLSTLTRLAALATVVAAVSCSTDKNILGPDTPSGGDIFRSYVALGNSITAGYQSAGINDSTQRQSYARLLAGAMGTQYHYPSLNMPGCPAPINNTQTGGRVVTGLPTGTTTPPPCVLRAAASFTDVLNNVAVPGANSFDPTSVLGVRPDTLVTASPTPVVVLDSTANGLTTFILGGKTQVQRALDARPTFVTIWIGNNDVLQPALSGLYQPVKTSQATFKANYELMLKQLTDSMPALKGVLIGVAKAQNLPTMVSGALIYSSAAAQGAINAGAGKTVLVDASCNGSASLVNVVSFIQAVRAGSHPAILACTPGGAAGAYPAPIGNVYVLDQGEQNTLNGIIDGYNNYIAAAATARGFAYLDPNTLFAAARANGSIPAFPNFASTNATFGSLISLDGVHPNAAAHVLIANALIDVINAKYGTSLSHVTGA